MIKLRKLLMLPAVAIAAVPMFMAGNAVAIEFDGTGLGEDGAFHLFMAPPSNEDEKYLVNEKIDEKASGWGITSGGVWNCNETITSCRLVHGGTDWTDESYNIVYEYNPDALEKINDIFEGFEVPEDGFIEYDMELLSHWIYGGNLSMFSSEVKNAVDGYNLEIVFDARGGGAHPLVSHNIGMIEVFYDGSMYKAIGGMPEPMVVAPHIFYVSSDADDVVAALKDRMVQIYGEEARDAVEITKTNETVADYVTPADQLHYGILEDYLENKVYDFVINIDGASPHKIIIVKDSDKIFTPSGVDSTDLLSGVNIKAGAVNLPGDTIAYGLAFDEKDETISEVLGTDDYMIYELGLWSSAIDDDISDSDAGFRVSIPVPKALEGKVLSAYWINFVTGEPEEHYADITEDGYAVFDTNHFSTYILAESSEDRPAVPGVPDTGVFAGVVRGGAAVVTMLGVVAGLTVALCLGFAKNRR